MRASPVMHCIHIYIYIYNPFVSFRDVDLTFLVSIAARVACKMSLFAFSLSKEQ